MTKPFVLFVSTLWQYKNCDGLLRAWAMARSQLENYQVAIVGAPSDEKYVASLHSLAAELGISGIVVFVGGVPLEETVQFYRAADVFVYPSLSETFGLPILEAMACGCPVVTSNISAMPEIAGGAGSCAILRIPGPSRRLLPRRQGREGIVCETGGSGGPASSPGGRRALRPSMSIARSPSAGAIDGHEDPRYRRRGVHRVTYLRPAACPGARRDRARRRDPARTPERTARLPESRGRLLPGRRPQP